MGFLAWFFRGDLQIAQSVLTPQHMQRGGTGINRFPLFYQILFGVALGTCLNPERFPMVFPKHKIGNENWGGRVDRESNGIFDFVKSNYITRWVGTNDRLKNVWVFCWLPPVLNLAFFSGPAILPNHTKMHSWLIGRFMSVNLARTFAIVSVPFLGALTAKYATEDLINARNEANKWVPLPRYVGSFTFWALHSIVMYPFGAWMWPMMFYGWNWMHDVLEFHGYGGNSNAVSYTHLTLPTSDLV